MALPAQSDTVDLRTASPPRASSPPTGREHKLRRRGSRIGNYTIKDVIGWGGMGEYGIQS